MKAFKKLFTLENAKLVNEAIDSVRSARDIIEQVTKGTKYEAMFQKLWRRPFDALLGDGSWYMYDGKDDYDFSIFWLLDLSRKLKETEGKG